MSDVEILREVSSDTLELSYFLCEQLLLNYSEEISLFNCSTPEERIRMANEFCRVWLYPSSHSLGHNCNTLCMWSQITSISFLSTFEFVWWEY